MNHDWTIDYNGGNPEFNPPVTEHQDLNYQDTVTVSLNSSFDDHSGQITAVTFYANSAKNEKGAPTNAGGDLGTEAPSLTQRVIEDLYNASASSPTKIYWVGVSGTADTGAWSVDPELRLKPGLGGS